MYSSYQFYRKPCYNKETQEQLWQASIADSHDSYCGCTKPVTHLIDLFFPEGHQYRHLTIDQIIRKEKEDSICLFGGKEDAAGCGIEEPHTTKGKDILQEKEENLTEEGIEELIAAVDDAEAR